jgi:hypothetical protein
MPRALKKKTKKKKKKKPGNDQGFLNIFPYTNRLDTY